MCGLTLADFRTGRDHRAGSVLLITPVFAGKILLFFIAPLLPHSLRALADPHQIFVRAHLSHLVLPEFPLR